MFDPTTFTGVPRIETARLRLRELRLSDFEVFAANSADPEAMRYMSGAVDRRTAWRYITAMTGGWQLTGAGWWAVELLDGSAMVGNVGAFFRETTFHEGANADLELGWSFFRAHWGRGYAREAAAAALAFGFARHGSPRAIAYVDAANAPSIKVAEAIGMRFVREADFYGEKASLYACMRPGAPEAP